MYHKTQQQKKEGDYLGKDLINEFLELHPEHQHRKLSIDGNGNIKTAGGAVLAVPGSDGWQVRNLGGRPSQELKPYNLKVRLSEVQYKKITDRADREGRTKGQVIRNLIDEM